MIQDRKSVEAELSFMKLKLNKVHREAVKLDRQMEELKSFLQNGSSVDKSWLQQQLDTKTMQSTQSWIEHAKIEMAIKDKERKLNIK
jgi:hypothetical protein